MNRILFSAALTLTVFFTSDALAQSADDDFANRCAAPGVVSCVGFDNETSDIVRNVNLHPDGDGTFRAGLDQLTKTSGDGSLRFELPPPPHAGANIAGRWSPVSNDALGSHFGQNSTFYVQFRQRISQAMLDNDWETPGWKTVIFHSGQKTCAAIELTTVNIWMSDVFTMYTDCGGRGLYTNLAETEHNTGFPPYKYQQVEYPCEYGNQNRTDCFYFPPDEWVTYYFKFTIGTWDQPNSMVEVWIARESSSTYEQVIRVPNLSLSCNSATCTSPPGSEEGYDNLTFTPYMTGLPDNSGNPGVTSHMWFDELIVSTQPIQAPNSTSGPRPKSPTNLATD